VAAGMAGRLCAAVAEDSKIFTPFFDMTLSEAAFLPSEGNIFSGGNINTQVGLLAKATQKDQLFGLYNFNYSGPGFAPQDSKQFTDRSMSHGFNIEYRRSITDRIRLRPGVSMNREFRRTGAITIPPTSSPSRASALASLLGARTGRAPPASWGKRPAIPGTASRR